MSDKVVPLALECAAGALVAVAIWMYFRPKRQSVTVYEKYGVHDNPQQRNTTNLSCMPELKQPCTSSTSCACKGDENSYSFSLQENLKQLPITIFFASETGTSKNLAFELETALKKNNFISVKV